MHFALDVHKNDLETARDLMKSRARVNWIVSDSHPSDGRFQRFVFETREDRDKVRRVLRQQRISCFIAPFYS